MKRFILIPILFLLLILHPASAATPANPNALPTAKNILNYLYSFPNKADKRVISGQNIGGTWDYSRYDQYITSVHSQTGIWINTIEVDWDTPVSNRLDILIDHWNKDGLISVMWRPFTSPSNTYIPPSDIAQLYTPGTDAYTHWIVALDAEATTLSELQNAGVIVLWRPLNEMNGNWCWWCGQDITKFISLWQFTFNYLTYTKHINNLLWVYAPNHAYGTSVIKPVSNYYPGNQYVDIVGIDYYRNGVDWNNMHYDYNELLQYGKPFGLTEFGPDDIPPVNGKYAYNYKELIDNIKIYIPKTVLFSPWRDDYALINQNGTTDLLNDPWIVNAGDIDWKNTSFPTPTPTPPTINQLLSSWLTTVFDLNGDGKVNGMDFAKIIQ